MVGKKRVKKFNISNRLAYTLIVLALIVGLGVGVLANTVGTAPNPGHLLSQLSPDSPCSTGQVLKWDGSHIVCTNPVAGDDPRFTITTDGICYNAPQTCSVTTANCAGSSSIEYSFNYCSSTPPYGLDQTCATQCRNQKGVACDGTSPTCSGGGFVYYTGGATSCSSSLNILYCSCYPASGVYQLAQVVPAGQRCV